MVAQAPVGRSKPLENFDLLQTFRIGHEFLDDFRRRLDEIGYAADGKTVQPFQLHRQLGHFYHDRNAVDHRRAVDRMPLSGANNSIGMPPPGINTSQPAATSGRACSANSS